MPNDTVTLSITPVVERNTFLFFVGISILFDLFTICVKVVVFKHYLKK